VKVARNTLLGVLGFDDGLAVLDEPGRADADLARGFWRPFAQTASLTVVSRTTSASSTEKCCARCSRTIFIAKSARS